MFNLMYSEYSYEDDIAIKTQEAMEKGMEKGRKEGEKIGMEKTIQIIKLLSKGKTPEEIAANLKITQKEVNEIIKKLD